VILDPSDEVRIGELIVSIESLAPKDNTLNLDVGAENLVAPDEIELDLGGDLGLELGSAPEQEAIENEVSSSPDDISLGDIGDDLALSIGVDEPLVNDSVDSDGDLDLSAEGSLSLDMEEEVPVISNLATEEEPPVLDLGGGTEQAPVLDFGDAEEEEPFLDMTEEPTEDEGIVEELIPGETELSLGGEDPAPEINLPDEPEQIDEEGFEDFNELSIDDSFEELQDVDDLLSEHNKQSEQDQPKLSFFAKLISKFKNSETAEAEEEIILEAPKVKSGSMAKQASTIKHNKVVKPSYAAATPITRIFAFGADMMHMLIVFQLMSRNQLFFSMIDDLNAVIGDFYNTFLGEFISSLLEISELAPIKSFLSEIEFLLEFKSYILVFVVLRVISTLVFGVSFGQFIMGARSSGSFIWSRIGGGIRETIGFVLLPLSPILDLPSLFALRTFKEAMTFTCVRSSSIVMFWLGFVIGLPMLVVFYFASPLFENFETPKQYFVENLKIQLIKNKDPKKLYGSKMFNLSYYKPENVIYYPILSAEKGEDSKRKVEPSIRFLEKDEFSCELSVYKKFDIFKLLKKAKNVNVLFQYNFPLLNRLIVSEEGYLDKLSRVDYLKTSEEFERLVKISFELGTDNIVDHIIEHGPFLAGYAKFKELFYDLVSSGRLVKSIQIKNINNSRYLVADLGKGIDSYDLFIIPLNFDEGYVYKLTLSTKNARQQIAKINKHVLDRITWHYERNSKENIITSVEKLFGFDVSSDEIRSVTDRLYVQFYELARGYMQNGNKGMVKTLKRDLFKTIAVLERLSERDREHTGLEFSPYDNLTQNLNEIINAMNVRDRNFFELKPALGVE
jgi:hypothetical protein